MIIYIYILTSNLITEKIIGERKLLIEKLTKLEKEYEAWSKLC